MAQNRVHEVVQRLRLVYRCHRFSTLISRKTLVEYLISVFDYCDVVYGPCISVCVSNQFVQNWCCHFIFGLEKFDHVSRSFLQLLRLRMNVKKIIKISPFFL